MQKKKEPMEPQKIFTKTLKNIKVVGYDGKSTGLRVKIPRN